VRRLAKCEEDEKIRSKPKDRKTRESLYARWHIPCPLVFSRRKRRKINNIYLVLSVALVADGNSVGSGSGLRSRAGALILGVERCVQGLRARARASANRSSTASRWQLCVIGRCAKAPSAKTPRGLLEYQLSLAGKNFSSALLNIESLWEENSMICTKCNTKFPDRFYCLKCGHVPPREAKVEDLRGELKQAA